MDRNVILNSYFEWLYQIVSDGRYSKELSYRKLLSRLHDIEFTYIIQKDKNRAADGVDLRCRFAQECSNNKREYNNILCVLNEKPCSVLEMMTGLAIRCEETIMDDPSIGNRTGQWFWGMIANLGLGHVTDSRYEEATVDEVVNRFLKREYCPNGKGGLFTVRNCTYDLRDVEIWTIMLWYLDSICDISC